MHCFGSGTLFKLFRHRSHRNSCDGCILFFLYFPLFFSIFQNLDVCGCWLSNFVCCMSSSKNVCMKEYLNRNIFTATIELIMIKAIGALWYRNESVLKQTSKSLARQGLFLILSLSFMLDYPQWKFCYCHLYLVINNGII